MKKCAVLVTLLIFATSLIASANALPPSSAGVLPDFFIESGTLLASISQPFVGAVTGEPNGTLLAAVYMEPSGSLDFLYQILNSSSSTDSVLRSTDSSFAGFTVDAGFAANLPLSPFVPGLVLINNMDRSASGKVVGFNFLAPAGIPPGFTSVVMEIQTNATHFTTGFTSISDGGTATVRTFAPIPEPASLALLGAGLVGLAGVIRRKLVG